MPWFYNFAKTIVYFGLKLCYHIEFEGLENLPKKGGFVVVCNHRSMADPIILAWKVKPMIHFMGKAELFRGKFLTWLFHLLGGFAVERGTGDSEPLRHAISLVDEGRPIGIFPEGTRSPDGAPGRPKSGAALIVKASGADVLPCAICYEGKLKFRKKIVFKYGKLIPFDELGFEGDSPRGLKRATKCYWAEVLKLLGQKREDQDETRDPAC